MPEPSPLEGEGEVFFVSTQEGGIRMDKLLAERFPQFSRTYLQALIQEGHVLLNGTPIKKRIGPEAGDEVKIHFQPLPETSLTPESLPLDILYEDDHLLAVNKPAGLVVHPAPGNWSGTFVNALLFYLKGKAPGEDPLRPGIVHRLDKETSGILLAAKSQLAHQKLIDLFARRQMEKLYLAICCGKPQNGSVNAPIGRHPIRRQEMAILPQGREAITEISVAAYNELLSLVLAKPKTGRTHQIRLHLKKLGAPVLGDPLYGNAKLNNSLAPPRLLLHAYRLNFEHPITHSPLKLTAPLPTDFKFWMQKLSQRPCL